ncbi:MAG: HprK-related kinase B, partial [Myxococcales bacterium]|nr:HprK-related kinase B [Myxococcales bacterium]
SFIDGRMVRKRLTTMLFCFTETTHLAIGPCLDNDNQVVNFINSRYIQWLLHRGGLLCHAAGVSRNGRGIGLAGFSGMGKSTLALRLMNDRRLDFLSNDRVMIHARAQSGVDAGRIIVEGVPKHPRINPGTILYNAALGPIFDIEQRRHFAALDMEDLWALEHKFDGLIRTCFPGQRFLLRAELAGVVLLNWTREGGPVRPARIDVDQRRDLLPALMKAPGVFYQPGADETVPEVQAYVDLLAGVPVLELAGGIDFDRGRHAAIELLGL